jgi:hypothetical protein
MFFPELLFKLRVNKKTQNESNSKHSTSKKKKPEKQHL